MRYVPHCSTKHGYSASFLRLTIHIFNHSYNEIYRLQFVNTWLGIYDNDWMNPANWSCGTIPDSNTDVEVETGAVLLNANISCRSLTIKSGATVTVGVGYKLTITH